MQPGNFSKSQVKKQDKSARGKPQILFGWKKLRHFDLVSLQKVANRAYNRRVGGGSLCGEAPARMTATRIPDMSNEENDQNVVPAPTPEPAPSNDTQNRLSAAREFASEQYEKLRRVTADQLENVRRYTQDARRQLNEGWDVTRTKAKDLHHAGEEYVKANPTTSVLGALGVGLVLGLLLGSRR